MAKLQPIEYEELVAAVNAEGLGKGHPFESELDLGTATKEEKQLQVPGTIGVTRNANDAGYLCYVVDENHRMTKCSTHPTWEHGYAMALRRYREFAAAEKPEVTGKDTFELGPVSNLNSPYRAQIEKWEAEQLAKPSRKKIETYKHFVGEEKLLEGVDIWSRFKGKVFEDELWACIQKGHESTPIDDAMVSECAREVLTEYGVEFQGLVTGIHRNKCWDRVSYTNSSSNYIFIGYESTVRPQGQAYAKMIELFGERLQARCTAA